MTAIKIYSGLSLDAPAIERLLPGAIAARPIKRGDLRADIAAGVAVIGIVDGEFAQSFAVAPSEIMDAIRCGLTVYGSSSMGALRAAELAPFGMIGVGRVYEHIVRAAYFEDDHLGQLFYEGFAHATLPFVDFLFAAEELASRRVLTTTEAARLVALYRATHFSERSLDELLVRAKRLFSRARHAQLATVFATLGTRTALQKRRDALALLQTMRRDARRHATLQRALEGLTARRAEPRRRAILRR